MGVIHWYWLRSSSPTSGRGAAAPCSLVVFGLDPMTRKGVIYQQPTDLLVRHDILHYLCEFPFSPSSPNVFEICRLQATAAEVDLLYLCDSEAALSKVSRWIGSGPRTTLAGDANTDIMASIIECMRERVLRGARTFIVKVKASRRTSQQKS